MQNETPIIQKVYDFYLELYSALGKMPQHHKYTLGQKIQLATLDIIEQLIGASYAKSEQKLAFLNQANIKLELIKLLIRLAEEIKAIPTKKYLSLEEKLQEIGRMLGGWIKSIK